MKTLKKAFEEKEPINGNLYQLTFWDNLAKSGLQNAIKEVILDLNIPSIRSLDDIERIIMDSRNASFITQLKVLYLKVLSRDYIINTEQVYDHLGINDHQVDTGDQLAIDLLSRYLINNYKLETTKLR